MYHVRKQDEFIKEWTLYGQADVPIALYLDFFAYNMLRYKVCCAFIGNSRSAVTADVPAMGRHDAS